MKITLSDVLVSSYKVAPQGPGVGEIENVGLDYQKIEYSHARQKADGSFGSGLDHPGRLAHAIAAYERAGFQERRRIDEHGWPAVLLARFSG